MSTPQDPSEVYRQQVQHRTAALLSGERPRDSQLSSLSTGRLILEAVVEELRIYRLHKEEKVRKEKEKEQEKRRMRKHGRHRKLRTRRDVSRERERKRSRSRERDRGVEGEEEKERRERSESRTQHRRERRSRHTPNATVKSTTDQDPRYMMTGGAGPSGPSSASRVPQKVDRGLLSDSRATTSRQTQRIGSDGQTPFGELPKKVAGVGAAKHFMNVYRHIKAEHEAGHRSRGVLERRVDGLRRKGGGAKTVEGSEVRKEEKPGKSDRDREKGRRGRRGRNGDARDGESGVKSRACDEGSEVGLANDSAPGKDRYERTSESVRPSILHATERPVIPQVPQHNTRRPLPTRTYPHSPPNDDLSPPAVPPKDESCSARAHPAVLQEKDKPPQDKDGVEKSVSVSQELSSARNPLPGFVDEPQTAQKPATVLLSAFEPPSSPVAETISAEIPAPQPPVLVEPRKEAPAPFPASPLATAEAGRVALLSAIAIPRKLRKLRSTDKRDNSGALGAGQVIFEETPVYQETPQSQEVEEHEREQLANRAWSDMDSNDGNDEDEENDSRRRRILAQMLHVQFGGGSATLRSVTGADEATTEVQILEKEAELLEKETTCKFGDEISSREERGAKTSLDKRSSAATLHGDGVFSNLAAHVGMPSWDWPDLLGSNAEK